MQLTSLSLEQFRSYDKLEIGFEKPQIELFLGPNGSGKTNLIEAVCILSQAKSCLGMEDEDVIRWEKDFFRVRALTRLDDGQDQSVEVVSQRLPRRQKACFVNDVRIPFARFIGQLPTVAFLPEDLHLFTGSPDRRRGFLDALLTQLYPEYLLSRMEYERVLKQRNSLLRLLSDGQGRKSDLDPWDEQAARFGAAVQLQRVALVRQFGITIGDQLRSLGEQWKDVGMTYVRKSLSEDGEVLEKELLSLLQQHHDRDIAMRTTSVGPHRDDWQLHADGHNIALFASRGQQRTSLIALLLVSVSLFELHRREKPVVLLDDVFSELDERHQDHLLSSLQGYQAILTTTHLPHHLKRDVSIWNVENGQVHR